MKKIVALCIALSLFPLFSVSAEEELFVEPYSDAYIAYMNLPEEERASLIPPLPVESTLDGVERSAWSTFSLRGEAELPVRYDSRNVDVDGDGYGDVSYISTPRNQMQTNACWAFATVSCMESFLRKKQFEETGLLRRYTFSERHVMHSVYPEMRDFTNTDAEASQYVNSGGNVMTVSGYTMRGAGPVAQDSLPFDNRTEPLYRAQIQQPAAAHIRGVRYVSLSEIDEFGMETLEQQFKKAIMDYGEVIVSIDSDDAYFNDDTHSFYDPTTDYGIDHSVTLVGWDDAYPADRFSITPGRDGAWIAKNSWGVDGNDFGYFYISFDTSSVYNQAGHITDAVDTVDYDQVYYNSPILGLTSVGYQSGTAYAANTYKKQPGAELLTDVAFSVRGYTEYEIYVNAIDAALTGDNVHLVQSGTASFLGYNTVRLDQPITLTGEAFAVIVKYTTPGTVYTVPVVMANELVGTNYGNVSFLSSNGRTWQDSFSLGYVCPIHAYTEDIDEKTKVQFEKPLDRTFVSVYSNGVLVRPHADGSYSLTDGTYEYVAETFGYADITNAFTVNGEESLTVTVPSMLPQKVEHTPPRVFNENAHYICTKELPEYAVIEIDYGSGNLAATSCTPYISSGAMPEQLYKIEGNKLLISKTGFEQQIGQYKGISFWVQFDDVNNTRDQATIQFVQQSVYTSAEQLKKYLSCATNETTKEQIEQDAAAFLPYGGNITFRNFSVTYPTATQDGTLSGEIVLSDGQGRSVTVDCTPYKIRKFTQKITPADDRVTITTHQNVPGLLGISIMAQYDAKGHLLTVEEKPLTEQDQTVVYDVAGRKKLFLLNSYDWVTPYDCAYTVY